MLLDGLHIPVTTPFYPDGRLYLRKLEHNVDRYSRTPAAGLALLGATGEASLLSDSETREVLETAAGACAATKVLTADVSRDSVRGTLNLAETAARLAYDAVSVHLPKIFADNPDAKSVRTYFQAVADRSPLPILLHDPAGTLPLDLVAELSSHASVLGLLLGGDSRLHLRRVHAATAHVSREVTVTPVFAAVTNRMRSPEEIPAAGNYISAGALTGGATALATAPPKPAIRTRTKKVGFQILTARTASLLDALEAGAAGGTLPFAASAPQAVYEVIAAWKDGDPKLAAEKQERLRSAVADIEESLGIAALKAACDLNGYYGGKPRLPYLPLTGEERASVETLMLPMRN